MTGRQKIEAAFSREGTRHIPAVICYEDIYVRDHWDELTSCPWWYQHVPDVERQMSWRRQVIATTGQDWFFLPLSHSRAQRDSVVVEARQDGVFRLDRRTGKEEPLARPPVGGSLAWHYRLPGPLAETSDRIDEAIPLPSESDARVAAAGGRADLAAAMLAEFGEQLYPMFTVGSPISDCCQVWGFEGMMEMIGRRPDLVRHACERFLQRAIHRVRLGAAIGAKGIWIEEVLTDAISPGAFQSLNVPVMRQLVEEVRALGLKGVYYYCGDPAGKWEQILSIGADALSLEETKKGFTIDIEHVVARAQGRCVVLGNLDALRLLANGTERQLRAEISRQISAGRRNGSRFIMSIGSPVTPRTPVERVRLYCDLVHELGRA